MSLPLRTTSVFDFLGHDKVGNGDIEGFAAGSAPAMEHAVSARPELDHDSGCGCVQFICFAAVGAKLRTALSMHNRIIWRTTR
jgi:hypothetical protein